MVPYLLTFHGVRDYVPAKIRLGELDEHILITGPNGVGKSTLTFIIGAILSSAKVELEGLRSSNLAEKDPWHAKLTLVFKNDGPSRIDAPNYVAFELAINQESKFSLIQREYRIMSGDVIGDWQQEEVFVSGGKGGMNYGAYQENLAYKYKIDPDLYYLIWYQQEVNQFAAMEPVERFRQFSDMFHISKMQSSWEAALESVKEVEQEILELESTVKVSKIRLNGAKVERDNLLDNRRRLLLYGKRHFTCSQVLLEKYEDLLAKADESLYKLQEKVEDLSAVLVEKTGEKTTLEQELAVMAEGKIKLEANFETAEEILHERKEQQKELAASVAALTEALEDISEKAKGLRFDEVTTDEKLVEKEAELSEISEQIEQQAAEKKALKVEERDVSRKISDLKTSVDFLSEGIDKAHADIKRLVSRASLEEQLDRAQGRRREIFEARQDLEMEIMETRREIDQLAANKIVSERQEKGLEDLRSQGITAYTLRDLVELMPNVRLDMEEKIAPIKYTVFYEGNDYAPVNDLYYVGLAGLVPDRGINQLTKLGLQMRADLPENLKNHANKVLWWIEKFFREKPEITERGLVDERGVRGAQEVQQYILNDQAIKERLAENREKLHRLTEESAVLAEEDKKIERQINTLHGSERVFMEAESVLLKESELAEDKQTILALETKLNAIYDEEAELDLAFDKLRERKMYANLEWEKLSEEMRIYEELGEVAQQQILLEEQQAELKLLNEEILNLAGRVKHLDDEIGKSELEIRQTKRKYHRKVDDLEELRTKQERLEKQSQNLLEKKNTVDVNITSRALIIDELVKILPEEACVLDETVLNDWSVDRLFSEDTQAKINFDNARNETVNENAERNYETMQADFNRKKSELTQAEILLDRNKTRAADAEDQLETTINMHLAKINMLFQKYMNLFQFEGLIEKERREDKNGRIFYELHVKARKEGHRGAMEDVSLKARNGKVGKGVSGGEESLSSLLFALALMQNLHTSPSYIILDEFDSALDDERKDMVFKLYASELKRKLIILSPKAHDEAYYNYFSKVFIVEHDPLGPVSRLTAIERLVE